ncbi:MAG: hypothetical protein R2939_21285 [Kofleriaceae bacterium]
MVATSRALGSVLLTASLLVGTGAPATAEQPDYFGTQATQGDAVRYRTPGHRTPRERWLLGGLLVGAGVLTLTGGALHLAAGRAADDVAANSPTMRSWTPADAERYDAARLRSGLSIGAFVGAGTALVAAAVVAFVTSPPSRWVEASPRVATPSVEPVRGGLIGAARWSF